MRKALIVLSLLLLPSALWAQGALRVSQVVDKVEWRAGSSKTFVPLVTGQVIQAGDEVRTGYGASAILMAPDSSYMVVSENSRLTIDDFWSGNFKSIMNLMLGQVRFYIQKLGGRPNPYSIRTPTALIAVRGTTFDVFVDDSQIAEVRCLEGQVTVENIAMTDREVVLDGGFKTLVRPGEIPTRPVRNEAELNRSRTIAIHKKSGSDVESTPNPSINILAHDNDRRNRTSDPLTNSNSRTNSSPERAKPSLSFPQ
jgi:hypothetical protein